MTDKEIIRAIKCCTSGSDAPCMNCPQYKKHLTKCVDDLMIETLDLINRQQAEIDKLKRKTKEQDEIIANSNFAEFYIHKHSIESIEGYTADIYKRAIKEFVKAIEERLERNWDASWEVFHSVMGSIQELAASRGVE